MIRSFSPRVDSDDAAKTTMLPSFCSCTVPWPFLPAWIKVNPLWAKSSDVGPECIIRLWRNTCERDPCYSSQAEVDTSLLLHFAARSDQFRKNNLKTKLDMPLSPVHIICTFVIRVHRRRNFLICSQISSEYLGGLHKATYRPALLLLRSSR